jgi:hypothetical protein
VTAAVVLFGVGPFVFSPQIHSLEVDAFEEGQLVRSPPLRAGRIGELAGFTWQNTACGDRLESL